MKYTIEPQLNNYAVNLTGPVRCSPDMIWTIMDGVFSLGADQIMLASSVSMRNWTINVALWYHNTQGVADYIYYRMMGFDQIYCQTLEQAELVVKLLEQQALVNALKQEY